MTILDSVSTQPTPVERGLIHDLRNLFGVVASAKHMLEDRPPSERRAALLAAIEDAAHRGGELTSSLLAHPAVMDNVVSLDVSQKLLAMAPMIRAMAGRQVEVSFDLAHALSEVKLVPGLFEATILELVANASEALREPGHILIRTRLQGSRVRITIADDGVGMNKDTVVRVLADHDRLAVKGTGLGRVRHFARLSHGRMRLRSRCGRGTVVTLLLPTVLHVAADEPAARVGQLRTPRKKRTIS